jgi:hypothetical protein
MKWLTEYHRAKATNVALLEMAWKFCAFAKSDVFWPTVNLRAHSSATLPSFRQNSLLWRIWCAAE